MATSCSIAQRSVWTGLSKFCSGRIKSSNRQLRHPIKLPIETSSKTAIQSAIQLALHVLAPNNLTLRGNDLRFTPDSALGLGSLDVTLGGDPTIRKSVDERATVSGAFTAVRGFYGFQGRQFAVERGGSIKFVGGNILDSAISVAATRLVAGVEVRVSVQGTVRKPALQLT